uniref:Uncharacterized protein n=1 Tax=Stegastes partitus TaxID=144197 RepID=A0A3B5AJV5_9TELE
MIWGITTWLPFCLVRNITSNRSARDYIPPPDSHIRHIYQLNSWWRYVNFTAHRDNMTNCYVCSHMPHSSTHDILWPYSIDPNKTKCLAGNHDGSVNCSGLTDLLAWPQQMQPLKSHIPTSHLPPSTFPICVVGNGSTPVGELPYTLCNKTYSFCPPVNETAHLLCMLNTTCSSDSSTLQTYWKRDASYAIHDPHTNTTQPCWDLAPSQLGTRVLTDWYWLCGQRAYPSLPPHWGGLCALVMLSDHTFYMQRIDQHPSSRTKRQLDRAKFRQSFFPGIGVAEIRNHVEINRYALLEFINTSIASETAMAEEVNSIRIMVLQHRQILDLLTASQGDVCKIIGETCCTYIPDHAGEGKTIQLAIQNLTALQTYVRQYTHRAELGFDPLSCPTRFESELLVFSPLCIPVSMRETSHCLRSSVVNYLRSLER